jgi:hypothetical protein
MKAKGGNITRNPYGFYLSWELHLGQLKLPQVWGGNTSTLYNIFHAPLELLVTSVVFADEGACLRSFPWSQNSRVLRDFLEKSAAHWRELFVFFGSRCLRFKVNISGRKVGIIVLNTVDKKKPGQRTLSPEERQEIERLLTAIWASSASDGVGAN